MSGWHGVTVSSVRHGAGGPARCGYWVGWRLQSTMANVKCQDAPLT